MKAGIWTGADEQGYRALSQTTYTGWWVLVNLPLGTRDLDWFLIPEEIRDRSLNKDEVARMLQEQTFNQGLDGGMSPMGYEIEFREAKDLNKFIAELETDPEMLRDYYKESN